MVRFKKKPESETDLAPPKPIRRKANNRSALKTGRTLSAKRERLETSSERIATHQKLKLRARTRLIVTIIGFTAATVAAVGFGVFFSQTANKPTEDEPVATAPTIYKPTIEVIDENSGDAIPSRMSQYIGQAESDFREYNLIPTKAVIPTGAIREVDFYLDNHPGFIKMTIDRDTAVSAEDAFRMIRYLEEEQGITDYQYIDVRLPGKAYWK